MPREMSRTAHFHVHTLKTIALSFSLPGSRREYRQIPSRRCGRYPGRDLNAWAQNLVLYPANLTWNHNTWLGLIIILFPVPGWTTGGLTSPCPEPDAVAVDVVDI